ncbi:MAG: hypothetical protein R3B09_32270 [Nannocystaceae bacterium]
MASKKKAAKKKAAKKGAKKATKKATKKGAKGAKKKSAIQRYYGDLLDAKTNEIIRAATAEEARASKRAQERDGNPTIVLKGRAVYVSAT